MADFIAPKSTGVPPANGGLGPRNAVAVGVSVILTAINVQSGRILDRDGKVLLAR